MSSSTSIDGGARAWIQRNERTLAVAWIAGCALLLAVLAVWGLGLNGAERAIERWRRGWIDETERAREELEQGRGDAARARLERIVATNGVSNVKHRFDKEHERALALLAEAYAAQGKKGKALATLEQLCAFDPKNFDNHFRHAQALREFGETAAAKDAFERVLAIHPTHWPSVEARIDLEYDAGAYGPIPDLYERYLDAWLLARVRLVAGEREAWFELQADGRPHEAQFELTLEPGWRGEVRLETRGYSATLQRLEFVPALRVGEARGATVATPRGDVTAVDVASQIALGAVDLPAGAQRVRIELVLFKRVEAPTWAQVTKAYQNRLLHAELGRAARRTRVGGCDEAGTSFED